MEVTILMPCLNEAETVAICVRKAMIFLQENKLDGEVLVSDNGSTDASREIAKEAGARVVVVNERGYGSALIFGTKEARGKYIIMGDADDSYDFLHLMPFVEKLREGYDLVMGNRFEGGIEKGAMPLLHIPGVKFLSLCGRKAFGTDVRDYTLHSLRDEVGVVTQETYLFNGTIRENLLYAKPDATEEEMIEACKKANIYDFIKNQAEGLDTMVGNRGLKLSGTRQRPPWIPFRKRRSRRPLIR